MMFRRYKPIVSHPLSMEDKADRMLAEEAERLSQMVDDGDLTPEEATRLAQKAKDTILSALDSEVSHRIDAARGK